jgi:hypothetical protein
VLAYDGTLPHTHLAYEFAAGTGWFHARVAPLPVDHACLVLCEDVTDRRSIERDLLAGFAGGDFGAAACAEQVRT